MFKISKKRVADNKISHFINYGEMLFDNPQELSNKLEMLFNNGNLSSELKATGKWFTSNGQENYRENFASRKNPIFEFNGERYARVYEKEGRKFSWHKVAPVSYEIRNWNELPKSINPKGTGTATEVELEAEVALISGIPFQWNMDLERPSDWDVSTIKWYLENIFLEESLNLSRQPILEYTIDPQETEICDHAFDGNVLLQKITISKHVNKIGSFAFARLGNNTQIYFETGAKKISINDSTFEGTNFKYIYLTKDGGNIVLSTSVDNKLEKISYRQDFSIEEVNKFFNSNFRENYIQLKNWKEEGVIKFIPPEYTMMVFPSSEMQKYFVNNNNQRWGKLVKTLGFDTLEGTEKYNSLVDLMKIYYAIGGFSENQGKSEKALDYVLEHVAVSKNANAGPAVIGAEIHSRFSRMTLKGAYNPTFAQFFMKYYHENPDFMNFRLRDKDGDLMDSQDYLCSAHNAFESICKNYPNRVVNGNEERALLSPRFVAEHSSIIEYEEVEEGNELLAEIVGKYGYDQEQFDYIQEVYEQAKKIKDTYIIRADKAKQGNSVSFRVLEKDDPLGFVLGDITNCCQVIGGVGQTCVDDGYKNPNAGFLIFEESILDEQGKSTGETRVLGQAYIWYDPQTKTVCYDNIEIPTKVLRELRSGEKYNGRISSKTFIDAVEQSAEAIMLAMNENGVKVERVTTGKGYNDLETELQERFGDPEQNPQARHRNYSGYSDAKSAQYVIKTYDEMTKGYADNIRATAKKIQSDLQDIEYSVKNQKTI
jgi:hypothetical protein